MSDQTPEIEVDTEEDMESAATQHAGAGPGRLGELPDEDDVDDVPGEEEEDETLEGKNPEED